MGNIDCKCLKDFQQKEIVSDREDNNFVTTRANFEKQETNNYMNGVKGQTRFTPSGDQKIEDQNGQEIIEEAMLVENYMDYSMDFFDEINKYRSDSDLFVQLKNRYPSTFQYFFYYFKSKI